MLKLFFAEWGYYKKLTIFEYCLYLSPFIYLMFNEYENYVDVFSFMMFSMFFFFAIIIPIGLPATAGEKRERFYALLPLSVKTIGRYYIFCLILDNTILFILWIIFYLIKYSQLEPALIWTMISFSMHIYIIFLLIAIGGQFGSYFKKFRGTVLLLSIAGSVSLFIFSVNTIKYTYSMMNIESPLLKTYLNLIKSPSGALIMSLLAGLMLYLFYKLYVNRKYYLIIR